MNYGRHGARKRRKAITSPVPKFGNFFGTLLFKIVVLGAACAGAAGLCAAVGLFMGVIDTAPDVSDIDVSPAGYSTTVYDAKGNKITKLIAENSNRIYVTIDKIPDHLQNAFIAIEDERFRTHNGIDIKGIMRAGVKALTSGDLSQGASTITQQLLKNNVFTSWTSESSKIEKFRRKFQEQYCAVQLEKMMDKDVILENYLNTINLGQGTLGVQAASNRYFGKPASELTISESAVIAAITQNPTKWNPISHPENNKERRAEVLRKMRDQGYITPEEYDDAIEDDVYSRIKIVDETVEKESIYTYFVDELTEQVITDLQEIKGYSYTQAYNALYSGGLSIFTTQDPAIQRICDEEFRNEENFPKDVRWYLAYELTFEDADGERVNFSTQQFEAYFKQENKKFNSIFNSQEEAQEKIDEYKAAMQKPGYKFIAENISLTPQPQASVVIMDQYTGEVKAIVGGRGDKTASLTLNRATDTKRQPGSCFKVLAAYAPALDSAGFTLASTQVDEPYNYSNGRPVKNWYKGYRGVQTLRKGIEQSLNIVTVKTLTDITPQLGYDYLLNFGFTTLVSRRTEADGSVSSDITQALALGGVTDGVTNLELTAAYATIANKGVYNRPSFYTKIIDHDGNVLIDNTPKSRQVLRDTTAWLLTSAMEDVVTKGTGTKVNFGNMAIAGKTGTTSSNVDVWFAGFTPYYTCATWSGYDNNVHMVGNETSTSKLLWKSIMGRLHEDLEYKDFVKPEGVVTATICRKSGKLAVPGLCSADGSAVTEYFDEAKLPKESCDCHILGKVCAMTGLRAADSCPYGIPGVITVAPDGNQNASMPFCIHSYLNGMPLFDASNPLNAAALADPEAAAAAAAAAAAGAAQPEAPAVPEVPPAQ
ncbi:MAG: PBP1A family penicillin-binding protein [Lachnospiraceae bacterium]|nr:PBP1A family penicillin-binding protein [Lachnospiraceae bacterium]